MADKNSLQAAPSLYLSTEFVEQANQLGMTHIGVNLDDIGEVVHLGRHSPIQNLGGLMLHGSGEGTSGRRTLYQPVTESLGLSALTSASQNSLTRAEILRTSREQKTTVLALRGVQPSEPALSLELYRAASTWRDPVSQAGGGPDTWFGIVGGGTLGLAFYTIAVGLEMTPPDPSRYGWAVAIGAVVGGIIRPALRAGRRYYDTPNVEARRPIVLSPEPNV